MSNDTSTQLTVALSSEASIPKEINLLTVTVSSGGSTPLDETYDLTRDNNGYFPQTLALIPRDSDSINNPVTVTVTASDTSNNPVVARSVTASYVQGRTLLLPVALRMACFDSACGANQSCVGGQCVSAAVPTSALVDYKPEYVFAEPGNCFDMQTCVAGSSPLSVPLESIEMGGNVADCTFPLPSGTTATPEGVVDVNVAIEWKVAPGRIIVLEGNNAAEGWTVSTTDPKKGTLSQGICNAVKANPKSPGYAGLTSTVAKAGVLYVSTACPAKSARSPSCDPALGIGVACPGGTCAD